MFVNPTADQHRSSHKLTVTEAPLESTSLRVGCTSKAFVTSRWHVSIYNSALFVVRSAMHAWLKDQLKKYQVLKINGSSGYANAESAVNTKKRRRDVKNCRYVLG